MSIRWIIFLFQTQFCSASWEILVHVCVYNHIYAADVVPPLLTSGRFPLQGEPRPWVHELLAVYKKNKFLHICYTLLLCKPHLIVFFTWTQVYIYWQHLFLTYRVSRKPKKNFFFFFFFFFLLYITDASMVFTYFKNLPPLISSFALAIFQLLSGDGLEKCGFGTRSQEFSPIQWDSSLYFKKIKTQEKFNSCVQLEFQFVLWPSIGYEVVIILCMSIFFQNGRI